MPAHLQQQVLQQQHAIQKGGLTGEDHICTEHCQHTVSIPAGAHVRHGPHPRCTGARRLGLRKRQHVSGGCLLLPLAASCLCQSMVCMHISGKCFSMLCLQGGLSFYAWATSSIYVWATSLLPITKALLQLEEHAVLLYSLSCCAQLWCRAAAVGLCSQSSLLQPAVLLYSLSCCAQLWCRAAAVRLHASLYCTGFSVSGPQATAPSLRSCKLHLAAMQASMGSHVELPGPF